MKAAHLKYTVEVDTVDKKDWHQIIQHFDDNNIYQTWSYDAIKRGEKKLSHILLKKKSDVIAAAQVVIVKIPLLNTGVAHVKFGPLWQRQGQALDFEIYRHMLHAMKEEYSGRRGLLLRMKPWDIQADLSLVQAVRDDEGLRCATTEPYSTFVIDLSHTADELYAGLKRKWRQELRNAQKYNLEVKQFPGIDGINLFLNLYTGMQKRKKFADFSDIDLLHKYYTDLPEPLKPILMVCEYEGEPVAAIVFSFMGNRAQALFGVTTTKGRKIGASYVLNWSIVNWLNTQRTCLWYDLVGGVNDPGVRHFKAGLVGKCGRVAQLRDFDVSLRYSSFVTVKMAEGLRSVSRSIKNKIIKLKEAWSSNLEMRMK